MLLEVILFKCQLKYVAAIQVDTESILVNAGLGGKEIGEVGREIRGTN